MRLYVLLRMRKNSKMPCTLIHICQVKNVCQNVCVVFLTRGNIIIDLSFAAHTNGQNNFVLFKYKLCT